MSNYWRNKKTDNFERYLENREEKKYLKRKIHEQERFILQLQDIIKEKERIIRKMAIDYSEKEIELHQKIYKLKLQLPNEIVFKNSRQK